MNRKSVSLSKSVSPHDQLSLVRRRLFLQRAGSGHVTVRSSHVAGTSHVTGAGHVTRAGHVAVRGEMTGRRISLPLSLYSVTVVNIVVLLGNVLTEIAHAHLSHLVVLSLSQLKQGFVLE